MRKTLLAVAILATSSASQAQNVKVDTQDFGICAGSPTSSFGGWLAISAGRVCSAGSLVASSSVGTVDWALVNGPVEFNDFDFSGSGTFFLKQKRGNGPNGNGPGFIGPNENGPNDNEPNGNGPNGNGPDGNGPPGNGPHGNGPPGNGPDGNGPPGNGPDGNGPPGPPDNNGSNNGNVNTNNVDDALEDLVNQTNATPEPATLLLVASGLGGVGALVRRRSKRRNDEA